jgi:hypothetical protein
VRRVEIERGPRRRRELAMGCEGGKSRRCSRGRRPPKRRTWRRLPVDGLSRTSHEAEGVGAAASLTPGATSSTDGHALPAEGSAMRGRCRSRRRSRAMRPARAAAVAPAAALLGLPVLDLEERLVEGPPPPGLSHWKQRTLWRDVRDLVGPLRRGADTSPRSHTAARRIEGVRVPSSWRRSRRGTRPRSARGRRGRRRRRRPVGVTGPRVARSATSARQAKTPRRVDGGDEGAAGGARGLAFRLPAREGRRAALRARAKRPRPPRAARPRRGRPGGSCARLLSARPRRRRRRRGGGAPTRRAPKSTPRVRFQTSRPGRSRASRTAEPGRAPRRAHAGAPRRPGCSRA